MKTGPSAVGLTASKQRTPANSRMISFAIIPCPRRGAHMPQAMPHWFLPLPLLLILACRPPTISQRPDDSGPAPDSGDSEPPDDTDPGTDTQDTSPPVDTQDTAPPWEDPDCAALPEPPFEVESIQAYSYEDIDFDDKGHLVGNNGQHVYRSSYDGTAEIWAANLQFEAGMRMLPNGILVICLDTRGSLLLLHPDGTRETLIADLAYPNGLEIGRDARIYVAESSGNRIRRVDPETGESLILTQGVIVAPEGLTFNADFTALYMNSYSTRKIYKLPMTPEGEPDGELELWAENVGTGYLVGMAVDICDNLYVIDYGSSQILRYRPDGSFDTVVVESRDLGSFSYLPNMKWGSGLGGFSDHKLYVVDANNPRYTFEVDIGVRGKQW
jgi:hypothetical protein